MWHILFQAFVKYHLHCKHLNKILFEIVNFGFLQHFSEAIRIQVPLLQKYKCQKYVSTEANYYYTKFSSTNIKQEIIYMTCLMMIHL